MTGDTISKKAPKGKATTSGTQARPGTLDVYFVNPDGVKTYIGWALDKKKIAFFFKAADRHLNPENYGKRNKMNNRPHQVKKPAISSELLLPYADKLAAEIILKWINENNTTSPKRFELTFDLVGEDKPQFTFALDLHRAGHAFDLKPQPRGQILRDDIFNWIHKRDENHELTFDDFKDCMEKAQFDVAVISKMMNKVMWLSITERISKETLDEIKEYCRQTNRYESMKAMGEEIIKKLKDSGAARKGRQEESGR